MCHAVDGVFAHGDADCCCVLVCVVVDFKVEDVEELALEPFGEFSQASLKLWEPVEQAGLVVSAWRVGFQRFQVGGLAAAFGL
jgi:hypothetical protein